MRLIDADLLKKEVLGLSNCHNGFSDTYDKACIIGLIDEMPTISPKTGRWIPVTKRLPNSQETVIVSIQDDSGDTRFDYTACGWITTDKEYWIVDDEINNYVIAWMPLPDPWKGE